MRNRQYNVVIDTNVFVSAFIDKNANSPVVKILDMLYDEEIKLYYSDDIMKEYKEVLNRDKFDLNSHMIGKFINYIKKVGVKFNPKKIYTELIDESDKPFYELVMDKKIYDSKLITGNKKHFPYNVKIVTPSEFIKILNK